MRRSKRLAVSISLAILAVVAIGAGNAYAYQFTAAEYPATIEGELSSTMTITAHGGKVDCNSGSFAGEMSAATSEIEMPASYGECQAFGFIGVTETMNGCTYKYTGFVQVAADRYRGTTDIVCPPNKEITIDAGPCVQHIPPQQALTEIIYTLKTGWFGRKWIEKDVNVANLRSTMTKGFLCPATAGEATNGTIVATIATHARNSEGEPQDLEID